MNILLTGGAGYIGSSVAWLFIDKGHKVTIIDKNGRSKSIPRNKKSYIASVIVKKIVDKFLIDDKNLLIDEADNPASIFLAQY